MLFKLFWIMASSFFIFNAQANSDNTTKLSYKNNTNRIDDNYMVRINEAHWILAKEINLEGLVRLNRHFAIGPTLSYMFGSSGIHRGSEVGSNSFYKDETTRYKAGVKAMYTFRHINESGPYITGFGRYQSSEINRSSKDSQENPVKVNFDEAVFGATAGYQWQVGRLRISLGLGYELYSSPDIITLKNSNGTDTKIGPVSSLGSLVLDSGVGLTF